jgi:hypothetical protein
MRKVLHMKLEARAVGGHRWFKGSNGKKVCENRRYYYYKIKIGLSLAGPSGRAVYGRSPAAIVGSNPTEGMDVCLLCVCVVRYRSLRRSDHPSRRVLPTVALPCV